MNNVKEYIEKIIEIGNRVPLSGKEICEEMEITASQWSRLKRVGDGKCLASTVRGMKRIIEKYKDVL